MPTPTFQDLLDQQWSRGRFVCVGLDPDLDLMPRDVPGGTPGKRVSSFLKTIIDATADIAGMYKPQSSFFEALHREGPDTLHSVIKYIRHRAPGVPVILDAKRGDIGSTNRGYIDAFFRWHGVDAVTINPYLGRTANQPFLDLPGAGIIVLCRTSNPGSDELQGRLVLPTPEEAERWGVPVAEPMPQYELVARLVSTGWNAHGNCSLVVGATYPGEMARIRRLVGNMPFLIPGVGAQGGSATEAVRAGADARGRGMIINSSRGILYAYQQRPDLGPARYGEAAAQAAQALHDEITAALAAQAATRG